MVSGQRPTEIAGMLFGILIFIAGYTFFECSKFGQQLIQIRLVRIVARIGYGIRILISIVFPLGMWIDIPSGALAMSISNIIFNTELNGADGNGFGNELLGFLWFTTTTVIQGIILNIILFVFLLILYGIGLLFADPNSQSINN